MEIYTDGSCDNRAEKGCKSGGWAFAVERPKSPGVWLLFYGYLAPDTTNNIAELYGFRNAVLMTALAGGHQVIHCDSQYVGYAVKNRKKWEAQGLDGRKNMDIIADMWERMDVSKTTFEHKWVRGHSGVVGNEVADKGAEWGEMRIPKPDVSGLELKYGVKIKPNYFETVKDFENFLKSKNALVGG